MSFSNVPLIDQEVHSYLSDLLEPSDYRDLLAQAAAQLLEIAARLRESLGQEELGRLAHRSKGSLGSLGLARLAFVAAQIESRCDRGSAALEDASLFHGIVADSMKALERLLRSLGAAAS